MEKGFLNLAKYTFLTNFQMSSLLAVFTSELSMWLVENYPEWAFAD